MKRFIAAIAAIVLFTGCSTLQIRTDHDPEFSFNALKNYTLIAPKPEKVDSLTYTHISRAINNTLERKGYRSSDKADADFYLLIHLDVKNVKEVQTYYEYAGLRPYPYNYYRPDLKVPYPPRPYIDPYYFDHSVTTSTHTFEYQQGKLVVDVFEPKSNKVIWRGIAEDEIRHFDSTAEKVAYINGVIEKLFESFPQR